MLQTNNLYKWISEVFSKLGPNPSKVVQSASWSPGSKLDQFEVFESNLVIFVTALTYKNKHWMSRDALVLHVEV